MRREWSAQISTDGEQLLGALNGIRMDARCVTVIEKLPGDVVLSREEAEKLRNLIEHYPASMILSSEREKLLAALEVKS
ncbi:MAG: hypothetical protein KF767_08785 [Bdellovibrionaceae bacterium]|nr:hypothetical protein [Pseudobdellovibrionaceae bacterium]